MGDRGRQQIARFLSAYPASSTTHLPDNFDSPTSSDVDIAVVLAQPNPGNKPTEFLYRDVLIEVNYPPWSDINSPEVVLGEYRRAGGVRPANILSDPSGELSSLFGALSNDFAKRRWAGRRCEDAMRNTPGFLKRVDEWALYHDQVTCWFSAEPAHATSSSRQRYRTQPSAVDTWRRGPSSTVTVIWTRAKAS